MKKISFNAEALEKANSFLEEKKKELESKFKVDDKCNKKQQQKKEVKKNKKKYVFIVDNKSGYRSGYNFKKTKIIFLNQIQMNYIKIMNMEHIRNRIKDNKEANEMWLEIKNKMKEKKAISTEAFNKKGAVINQNKEKEYITIREQIIEMKKNFIEYLLKNLNNK